MGQRMILYLPHMVQDLFELRLPELSYQFGPASSTFAGADETSSALDLPDPLAPDSSLAKPLRHLLALQVDHHGRVVALLQLPPLTIPPDVLAYYLARSDLSPRDRDAVYTVYIVNGAWTHLWDLVFQDAVATHDLDHVVGLIKSKSDALGLWRALAAAHEAAPSRSIVLWLRDSYVAVLGHTQEALRAFDAIQTSTDLIKDILPPLLAAYRLLLEAQHLEPKERHRFLKQALVGNAQIRKATGLASAFLEQHPSAEAADILADPTAHYSDKDMISLLQHASASKHPVLWLALCKNTKKLRRHIGLAATMEAFALHTHQHSPQTFLQFARRHHPQLLARTLASATPVLLRLAEGTHVLRNLRRDKFVAVCTRARGRLRATHLLRLLQLANRIDNRAFRSLLGALSCKPRAVRRSAVSRLITAGLTSRNAALLWRFVLRHKLLGRRSAGRLLAMAAGSGHKKPSAQASGASTAGAALPGLFRKRLSASSQAQRRRVFHRVYSAGLVLAQQHPPVVARVLAELQQNALPDLGAQRFVVRNLVIGLTATLYRCPEGPVAGLSKMRDVLRLLPVESPVLRDSVLQYTTRLHPLMAQKILRKYTTAEDKLPKSLVHALEHGLLRSEALLPAERLSEYRDFQTIKLELGYNPAPSRTAIMLMGQYMHAYNQESSLKIDLAPLFQLAVRRRLPFPVIVRWTKKDQH